MASKKQRLDVLLVDRGLCESRHLAQRLVRAGEVQVAGQRIDKPGTLVAIDAELFVAPRPRFVSRGGDKLAAALEAWPIKTDQRICLDGGISTGGFTDCLLQAGAARVYGIDVGYGQVAWSLRQDPRVILRERTNLRHLTPADLYGLKPAKQSSAGPETSLKTGTEPGTFPEPLPELPVLGSRSEREPRPGFIPEPTPGPSPETKPGLTTEPITGLTPEKPDLGVADVSFISLTKVLPALWQLLQPPREVVLLVKPQFEVGRDRVGKNGVVREPRDRARAIAQVWATAQNLGWRWGGCLASPLPGPAGNVEYLLWLVADERSTWVPSEADLLAIVQGQSLQSQLQSQTD